VPALQRYCAWSWHELAPELKLCEAQVQAAGAVEPAAAGAGACVVLSTIAGVLTTDGADGAGEGRSMMRVQATSAVLETRTRAMVAFMVDILLKQVGFPPPLVIPQPTGRLRAGNLQCGGHKISAMRVGAFLLMVVTGPAAAQVYRSVAVN